MHIPSIFHCGPRPHAAFPESLELFAQTLKDPLLPSPGTQSGRNGDQTLIPKDPFSWKKVESQGALGEPRREGAGEGGRRDPQDVVPLGYNASTGTARPPGRQGAPAGSAPSRLREPPRRRGSGPATRGALPSPPPPGVGRHSGVYAVARGAGAELLESPRADLLSMARSPRPAATLNPTAAAATAGGEAERPGSNAPPSALADTSSSQPSSALLEPSLPEEEEGNRRPDGASPCGARDNSDRARSRDAQVPDPRAPRLARVSLRRHRPHKRRLCWAESAADWAGGLRLRRRARGRGRRWVGGACRPRAGNRGGSAHHKLLLRAQRLQLPSPRSAPASTARAPKRRPRLRLQKTT